MKRVAVGQAQNPHRTFLNHPHKTQAYFDNGGSMTFAGWTHYLDWWAFNSHVPGSIRVAVGQAGNPHRMFINHPHKTQAYWNNGGSMTFAGWTQYYQFWAIPDDLVYDGIEYFIDTAQILASKPKVVGEGRLENHGSMAQKMQFNVAYTETKSHSFSHNVGVTIGTSTKVQTGIPKIAQGEVEVSFSASYSYTDTQTKTTSTSKSYMFPINVPPKKVMVGQCTVNEAKLAVPYKINIKSKSMGRLPHAAIY